MFVSKKNVVMFVILIFNLFYKINDLRIKKFNLKDNTYLIINSNILNDKLRGLDNLFQV